jgi:hypothetical protein
MQKLGYAVSLISVKRSSLFALFIIHEGAIKVRAFDPGKPYRSD